MRRWWWCLPPPSLECVIINAWKIYGTENPITLHNSCVSGYRKRVCGGVQSNSFAVNYPTEGNEDGNFRNDPTRHNLTAHDGISSRNFYWSISYQRSQMLQIWSVIITFCSVVKRVIHLLQGSWNESEMVNWESCCATFPLIIKGKFRRWYMKLTLLFKHVRSPR